MNPCVFPVRKIVLLLFVLNKSFLLFLCFFTAFFLNYNHWCCSCCQRTLLGSLAVDGLGDNTRALHRLPRSAELIGSHWVLVGFRATYYGAQRRKGLVAVRACGTDVKLRRMVNSDYSAKYWIPVSPPRVTPNDSLVTVSTPECDGL